MSLLDVFKGKEFKKNLESLKDEHIKLKEYNLSIEEKYNQLNKDYENLKSKQLTVEQKEVLELLTIKEELESYAQEQELNKEKLESTIEDLKQKSINILSEIKNSEKELGMITDDIDFIDYGLYIPRYNFMTVQEYKDKYREIREKAKNLIKTGEGYGFNQNYTFNNSKAKGKAKFKKDTKLMLRAFNNECEAAINKVKYNNIKSIEARIHKSFEMINNSSYQGLCWINKNYLDIKLDEMHIAYEYELKKQEEKEILREERQKEREERALQKEIKEKRKNIDKELTHLNNALSQIRTKLENATDEERLTLLEELHTIEENIGKYDSEIKELDYREQHTNAGYVYIISNIGSFGKDVFKIGVTRRLEPLERIYELSSASVPFKFDIHALIFSYEAYGLEKELHDKFNDHRINKVNSRKEFFHTTIDEIENILKEYENLTFEFNKSPEAEEYRQTQSIIKTTK